MLLMLLLAACASYEEEYMGESSTSETPSTDPTTDTADTGPTDTGTDPTSEVFEPVALESTLDGVQPMTGLVLWADDWQGDPARDVVQLEYAYAPPSSIVVAEDTYDWSLFDAFLDDVASRGHQAVARFYYTYPGRETAVPGWVKALPDYDEVVAPSEGQATSFPDWRQPELVEATKDLWTAVAERYDDDPRLAFVQVGFGLWGEYHIYDGPQTLGRTFPDKDQQEELLAHAGSVFDDLSFSISIDAGDATQSVVTERSTVLDLPFGLFDDSFMHEGHDGYNADMFAALGVDDRHLVAPIGGELSYYSGYDQQHALDVEGMYGRTFEELAADFHVSYMIGNDQPNHQSDARLG